MIRLLACEKYFVCLKAFIMLFSALLLSLIILLIFNFFKSTRNSITSMRLILRAFIFIVWFGINLRVVMRMGVGTSLNILVRLSTFWNICFPNDSVSVWESWLEIKRERISPNDRSKYLGKIMLKSKIKFTLVRHMIMTQVLNCCLVLFDQF